jgi:hypothetical protein
VILFQEIFQEFFQQYPTLYRCPNILWTLTKLRKATVSFVMPICLSIHLSVRSAPTRQIFVKFHIWVFSKICRENSSSIKIWSEKRVFLHEDLCTLYLDKFLE